MKILTNKKIKKIADELFDLRDMHIELIDKSKVDSDHIDKMVDKEVEILQLVGGKVAIDHAVKLTGERIVQGIIEELENGE